MREKFSCGTKSPINLHVSSISFSFLGTFFFFLPRGIVEMQSAVQWQCNFSKTGLLEKCVRKYTLLNPARARWCPCSVCPLCILYAFWLSGTCSFVVRHSFGDIWLVELNPGVTYLLPVRFKLPCPVHVRPYYRFFCRTDLFATG